MRRGAPGTRVAGSVDGETISSSGGMPEPMRGESTSAAPSSPGARQHAPPVPDPPRAPGRGPPLHVAARSTPSGRGSTPSRVRGRPRARQLTLSGCTTVFDHHYVFRAAARADERRCRRPIIGPQSSAARWTSVSDGGLPPDELVGTSAVLADTERLRRAARARHRPESSSPSHRAHRSRSQGDEGSAALAPTRPAAAHLAETVEEEYCLDTAAGPSSTWSGSAGSRATWCAHRPPSEHDIAQFAGTGTGVARCRPRTSGSGRRRAGAGCSTRAPLAAGVDGSASNSAATSSSRSAGALVARGAQGGTAMTQETDPARQGRAGVTPRRHQLARAGSVPTSSSGAWTGSKKRQRRRPVAGVLRGPQRRPRVVGGRPIVRDGALTQADRRDRACPPRGGA